VPAAVVSRAWPPAALRIALASGCISAAAATLSCVATRAGVAAAPLAANLTASDEAAAAAVRANAGPPLTACYES